MPRTYDAEFRLGSSLGTKAIEGLAVDTLVVQLAPAVLGAVARAIQG